MFKDMTNAQLDEAIHSLRTHLHNQFAVKQTRGVAKNLRDLDIATAVRAQRIRAEKARGITRPLFEVVS